MRLLIGSLVILLCFSVLAVAAPQQTPVVNVAGGQVQGAFEADGKVAVFKGIPYAAPPVGELRWRAPQPVSSWEGVRDATKFGPICPQGDDNLGDFFTRLIDGQGMGFFRTWVVKTAIGFAPKEAENEDCLYLNVRTANLQEKQPVMVWIHGGGHQAGSGSDNFYQSNSLPLKGVVLVTFNYRLGPLGYFAHPALSKESEQVALFGFIKVQLPEQTSGPEADIRPAMSHQNDLYFGGGLFLGERHSSAQPVGFLGPEEFARV